MDYNDFTIKSIEDFEIILESEGHAVSSTELISILANYRQLLKGVNITLNKKYAAGYDVIDFDVIAFDQGSFRIPIKIKKFSYEVAVAVVGGVIVNLLQNDVKSTTVRTSNEVIEVSKLDLMENLSTKEAVVNIAKTAVESDSISGLSLNYTKEDGTSENIRIEKKQLEPIASINTDVEPQVQTNMCEMRLVVVAPVLDDKKVQWKFRTQTGQNISAKMDDADFLEKLEKEHIAFGKHDVLQVVLETTVTYNEDDQPRYTHVVKHVIDYPRYKKNNAPTQLDLGL